MTDMLKRLKVRRYNGNGIMMAMPEDREFPACLSDVSESKYVREDQYGTLLDAIEKISANSYGLQGVIEDFGHDTNKYNFEAMKYFSDELFRLQHIAREAKQKVK